MLETFNVTIYYMKALRISTGNYYYWVNYGSADMAGAQKDVADGLRVAPADLSGVGVMGTRSIN